MVVLAYSVSFTSHRLMAPAHGVVYHGAKVIDRLADLNRLEVWQVIDRTL